eukprot:jgi/Ulvmu1/12601/UM092_0031.1
MPKEIEWARPLRVWQRALCQGGAFVAAFLLIFGIGGILVVTDKRKTGWLYNSSFGHLWQDLVAFNYAFIPLTVVGGMLGLLLCLHNLQQDSKAQLRASGAPQSTARTVGAKKRPQRAKKVD